MDSQTIEQLQLGKSYAKHLDLSPGTRQGCHRRPLTATVCIQSCQHWLDTFLLQLHLGVCNENIAAPALC